MYNRRGRGRGGRGNRGSAGEARPPTKAHFEGRESSLKGHVFDVKNDNKSDQYIRTKKEVALYVGRAYTKYTAELKGAVDNLVLNMPVQPVPPADDKPTAVELETWKSDSKEYRDRTMAYNDFKAGLSSVVLGQCTEALESNVRSDPGFANAEQDGIAMLIIIHSVMNNIEVHRNTAEAICDLNELFYTLKKYRYEKLQAYYERFKSHVEVMDRVGGLHAFKGVVDVVAADPTKPTDAERAAAVECLKAIRFIHGAGEAYKDYMTELKHAKLEGRDNYPVTLDGAFHILQRRTIPNAPPVIQDGVAFTTTSNNGRTYPDIRCNSCSQMGHYANHCPTAAAGNEPADGAATGPASAAGGRGNGNSLVLSQKDKSFTIPSSWILLDSQATLDVFCNGELLRDIRTVNHRMYIHCNAGTRWTNQQGYLPGYGVVWYCPQAIANILSLHNVTRRYRVEYDSENGNRFELTMEGGAKKVFNKSEHGLYYLDAAPARAESAAAVLVNTVDDNKTRYTNTEIARAKQARELQTKIGRPSTRHFIEIVSTNLLPNCPVTKRDIEAAEDIFWTRHW
jgi:hypothetical protein